MKTFITTALLIFIIGNIGAVDTASYQFIDHLRALPGPGSPEVYEDSVLFTASSSFRRVGISFAHDGYGRVHWFQKLVIPRDSADFYVDGKLRNNTDPNLDSGIMFHVEPIPENLANMDYRLIIDGLWSADPLNPFSVSGPRGLVESRVALPETAKPRELAARPGYFSFNYPAAPGETVTVAGSFNNWDPFMYEMRDAGTGAYTLTLPLPPGSFQYSFFHRGEQVADPANPRKLYTRDGKIVSEAIVP